MTERPVVFGRSRSLIGIACLPEKGVRRPGSPTVVFLNSGIIHRVGPHRIYVEIARSLARNGVGSLRFDLGGIGDSSVDPGETGSVHDFVRRDITDAVDWALKENRSPGVVLLGLCSGADNALQSAAGDPRIMGVVLIDPNTHRPASFFFHHFRRRLVSPRTWSLFLSGRHPVYRRLWAAFGGTAGDPEREVEPPPVLMATELPGRNHIDHQFQALLGRGCRMLFVFTGGLDEQYNHRNQVYRTYPALRGSPLVRVEYFPESDHTFSRRTQQVRLRETVVSWIGKDQG